MTYNPMDAVIYQNNRFGQAWFEGYGPLKDECSILIDQPNGTRERRIIKLTEIKKKES